MVMLHPCRLDNCEQINPSLENKTTIESREALYLLGTTFLVIRAEIFFPIKKQDRDVALINIFFTL